MDCSKQRWNTIWMEFITRVDKLSEQEEYILTYVDLISKTIDLGVLVQNSQEFRCLAQNLENANLISHQTYHELCQAPIRNFSRYAFPYMNCNPEVMRKIVARKDTILQSSSLLSRSTCYSIARQMKLICESKMHEHLPRQLTEEHFELLHTVNSRVQIKEFSSTSSVPLGKVLNNSEMCIATLCHVFASPKCLGGGVPSNGILSGGQEESIFAQNPLLLVIGVCLFGTPIWEGKECGNIEWKQEYRAALTAGSTIYFPFKEDKISWIAFYAAPAIFGTL